MSECLKSVVALKRETGVGGLKNPADTPNPADRAGDWSRWKVGTGREYCANPAVGGAGDLIAGL